MLGAAVASHSITRADYLAYRDAYRHARSVLHGLNRPHGPRARARELGAVFHTVVALAREGTLDPSRMPAVFLILRRNTDFWPHGAFPSSGDRRTFGADPVIFEYYPGEGWQFQPLANFSTADQLADECRGRNSPPGTPCRRTQLQALLDRLIALGSRRGGRLTWEYEFPFGGGYPPWTSAMSQATALQALAGAFVVTGEARYRDVGDEALDIFKLGSPLGVRSATSWGPDYLLYSFAPHYIVLNGFLQALIGLYDFGADTGSTRAKRLFAQADPTARAIVPKFDTGSWSRYSLGGPLSDASYHDLLTTFLLQLCHRTRAQVYCATYRRFAAYEGRAARSPGGPGAPDLGAVGGALR